LDAAGMTQSMSRIGRCIDDGPMEGFWGILKAEMYYLHHFDIYDDLKDAVDQFIYFYNNQRLQARLYALPSMKYHKLYSLPVAI
jgi:putative transposase